MVSIQAWDKISRVWLSPRVLILEGGVVVQIHTTSGVFPAERFELKIEEKTEKKVSSVDNHK